MDLNRKGETVPLIAKSWKLDAEGKGVSFELNRGVKFHDPKYGEMTSDDVIFSLDETAAEGTVFTEADAISQDYSSLDKIDDYNLHITFAQPTVRWFRKLRMDSSPAPIQSKKYFDEKGRDFVNLNAVATGPFKVLEHVADDHITLEAVPDHWRQTPSFARVDALEVPEEATRTAMLQSGEADMLQANVALVEDIKKIPGVRLEVSPILGGSGMSIMFAGQYQMKTDSSGNPRETYNQFKDLPWVGDAENPDSLEKARKVRWAMSMALDRQTMVEKFTSGLGLPSYVITLAPDSPRWDPKWEIPFDIAKAKQYLADAGYANGFSFTYFIPTGFAPPFEEVAESVAIQWKEIGLNANIEKATYSARRPTMVSRTIHDVWSFGWGSSTSTPSGVASSGMAEITNRSAWNTGAEMAKPAEFQDRLLPKVDEEEAWLVWRDYVDWAHEVLPHAPVLTWKSPWAYGPKIKSWEQTFHANTWPDNLESAQPAP